MRAFQTGGGGDRFGRMIAEQLQQSFRPMRLFFLENRQRIAEGGHAKVVVSVTGTINAIKKRSDVDQLRSVLHEVPIDDCISL